MVSFVATGGFAAGEPLRTCGARGCSFVDSGVFVAFRGSSISCSVSWDPRQPAVASETATRPADSWCVTPNRAAFHWKALRYKPGYDEMRQARVV